MSSKFVVISVIFLGIGALVYGLSGTSHNFSTGECYHCHIDAQNDPLHLDPGIDRACNACHDNLAQKKSHPTDAVPSMSIPQDMPLVEGKLKCITCHYTHPKESLQFLGESQHYLRRQVKGIYFCITCHEINEKGHIVYANIHAGSYKVTDTATRIDRMSLECIQCHDTYMKDTAPFLGSGTWNHFRKSLPHPIGISYKDVQMKRRGDFNPPGTLNREIRFFNDTIGCGTCHNIYSKSENMLVMENKGQLCLQCHNK